MCFVWIINQQANCSSFSEYFFFQKQRKLLHTWKLQEFKDHSTQNASKTQPLNSPLADLSLRYWDECARHLLLFHMLLWRSCTNNAWSYGINIREQNNSGAKALWKPIFLWRSKIPLSVTSSYFQKWISPGLGLNMVVALSRLWTFNI